MQEKEINYQFKLFYALGIIFIVAGHCSGGGISLFYDWFAPGAFHLELFMFASGYFYRKSDEQHLKTALLKKCKRILLPLYLWNAFYALFVYVSRFKGFTIGGEISAYNLIVAPITNGHQYLYNMGGWYIAPLIMIYVFNLLLRRLLGKYSNDIAIFFLYLAIGLVGIYAAILGHTNGRFDLMFVRFAYFLPWYGLGTLYRSKLEEKDKIPNVIYFTIIMTLQLIVITIYREPKSYVHSWCDNFDNLYMPYTVAALGLFFWLRICRIIAPVIKESKLILLIADNTFAIMLHQFLGFKVLCAVFGLIHKLTKAALFPDFSFDEFYNNIWYCYIPKGQAQWYILYVIAAITFSIVVQKLYEKIVSLFQTLLSKSAAES